MSKRRFELLIEQVSTIVGEMHTLHFRQIQGGQWGWEPLMNVYAYPDHYEIYVELAGVTPNDFRVAVDGHRVKIFGQRRWPDLRCKLTGSRCRRTKLMEIKEGGFSRTIELPEAVDEQNAEISIDNGLVCIQLRIKPSY